MSSVERLSSSRRLKTNYCYGKGVQKNVLCWEVIPFSEGPLSEVITYIERTYQVQELQGRIDKDESETLRNYNGLPESEALWEGVEKPCPQEAVGERSW